jgi:hypothetical protein
MKKVSEAVALSRRKAPPKDLYDAGAEVVERLKPRGTKVFCAAFF